MKSLKIFLLSFFLMMFTIGSVVSAQEKKEGNDQKIVKESKSKDEKSSKKTVEDVVDLRLVAELGFLSVVDHRIMFGAGNQYFDYITEGGQENLALFTRLSVDLILEKHHVLTFLYQPLDIQTTSTFRRPVTFGSTTFAAGDIVNIRYSFPYYRLTYMYDFFADDRIEVALGLGFQIRNADIEFTSVNGAKNFVASNIGFVPLIKFRTRYTFESGFILGTELDGFYAPVSILNGDNKDIEGLIVDWSVFTGFRWEKTEILLTVRYIGGGAQGKGSGDSYNPDGYNKNWLHFITASLGASYTLF